MSKENCNIKKTSIGGQALLEGIMMRGPKKTAMAVREPDGNMILEISDTKDACLPRIAKLPIIRGVVNFVMSMISGYKALMRSAEISGLEDETPKKGEVSEGEPAPEEVEKPKKKSSETITKTEMTVIGIIGTLLGVVLAITLFKVLPETLYGLLKWAFPVLGGDGYGFGLIRAAFTGVLKIGLLVLYMWVVTFMKDIKRTYMYHGAEHKTIFCYEHGHELTVENVRRERRFHPRCGTSFLILMLLVSTFITMFIPANLVPDNEVLNVLARSGIGIALLPIIMGIGYELIKLAGRRDNLFTRIISAPGVWLQHITTVEPTDDMIECAIRALEAVIPEDDSDKW